MNAVKKPSTQNLPIDAQLVRDVIVDSPEEAERIGLNRSTVRDLAEGKCNVPPEIQQKAQRALENLRRHGFDV